MSQTESEGQ